MKILVPIDLSATSENTVRYVVELSDAFGAQEIIFAANAHITVLEQLYPSPDYVYNPQSRIDELTEQHEEQFNAIQQHVLGSLNPSVKLKFLIRKEPLIQSITNLVEEEHPGLLVIGTSYSDPLNSSFIADDVVNIAKIKSIPVLTVPFSIGFRQINRILVPFKITNLVNLATIGQCGLFNAGYRPRLLLLNVENPADDKLTANLETALKIIIERSEWKDNYEIHQSNNDDTFANIQKFYSENDVQLIVAVPGKHSLFFKLTHESITAALLKNYYTPVLVLKPE